MTRISLSFCLIAALSLLAACSAEPEATVEETAPTIKGIWNIQEMDVGFGENRRTTVPQAFMIFIGDKYYSAIRDFSPEPRKAWTGEGSPEEGFRASIGSFMADAGTYKYDGSEFVVYHQVAMIPIMKEGSSMTFACHMEGNDTLILEPQYDKMVVPGGMKIKPSPEGKMGYGDAAVLYRFKRLE